MNDTPNPAPGPTVEEMLIAIFRLLVVVAIAAVTTIALLIMAAYGTPQPSGSAHVDQLRGRGQLHTAANGPLFRAPPGRCGNQPDREKRDYGCASDGTRPHCFDEVVGRRFSLPQALPGISSLQVRTKSRSGERSTTSVTVASQDLPLLARTVMVRPPARCRPRLTR